MAPDVQGRVRGEAESSHSDNRFYRRNPMQCQAEHRLETRPLERRAPQDRHPRMARLRGRDLRPDGQRRARRKRRSPSVDQIAGKAGEAERILDDADLRPTEEIVLIQSESSTVDDPAFSAVIDESARSSSGDQARRPTSSRRSTANGGGISEDGHSAFVEFEIEGNEKVAEENLEAEHRHGRAHQARQPRVHGRPVRRRQRQQSDRRHAPGRRRQGGDALAADHAADPARRPRRAGRGQRAAGPRPHLGAGDDGDGRRSRASCSRSAATSTR